ncbi:MAG: GspE/PulE family protein [Candidatus Eremiobacteraeota bacterium]|nr:GspE/PulE family protein [Candidatus Eremiobacteraeota bacterium]
MGTWLESVRNEIDPQVWQKVTAFAGTKNDPADFMLKGGYVKPEQVLSSLSKFHDLPSMFLNQFTISDEAVERIPEEVARRFCLMPLFILKDKIFVAVAEPGNITAEDFILQQTRLTMQEIVTTRENVESAINKHYLAGAKSAEKIKAFSGKTAPAAETKPDSKAKQPEVKTGEGDAPSIKFVDHILTTGIRLGASDIHLEPYEDEVELRYRVDGILRNYPAPPLDLIRAVTSRIKIISEMNVAEKRLPQDGRSTFEVDGKKYDLRISMIPNLYGESVVIRVLTSGSNIKDLDDLGFSPPMLQKYKKMISRPHGVILVTGPTGSGKSTTLYATLRYILSPEKKILTLEDPVESKIKGVMQFQMNAPIGYTFASCLRSVLRHDPEIVLVGEIRDRETAEIAIRASLTGHMLYSTLHTNDAASAPTRLIDMGVPGYLVMTSLIGVLAQRLIRRLCTKCKEPLKVEKEHLDILDLKKLPQGAAPYKPVGCGNCEKSGYRGRVAIYELLEITPEMRRLADIDMTSDKIQQIAEKGDFTTLRQSAIESWLAGNTGIDEVMKLTVE